MTEGERVPYRGGRCIFILRPYGNGWEIDIEIDGEIKGGLTHSIDPTGVSRDEALQEAAQVANAILVGTSGNAKSQD